MQGYDIIARRSFGRAASHMHIYRYYVSCAYDRPAYLPSDSPYTRISYPGCFSQIIIKGTPWLSNQSVDGKRSCFHDRQSQKNRFCLSAVVDVSSAVEVINDLGSDSLTLLVVIVLVVPAFKTIKASPVS